MSVGLSLKERRPWWHAHLTAPRWKESVLPIGKHLWVFGIPPSCMRCGAEKAAPSAAGECPWQGYADDARASQ